VLEVMDGIYRAREELNEGILKERGLQLDQVYDETEYIYSAIGLVRQSIVIGGILTILVLLLFLRSGRSTLVIALAIPTSIVGTFLLLNLMGRSLNVISLAGLAFAVGMLVDNAVVVLENVYRRYQMGERRVTAAVKGTQEVWGAVVASTLTTLAVFLPILFVEEEAGQLFRDIALAISCSVGLSLIISVTLIPTLTSRILSTQHGGMAGEARAPASRNPIAHALHKLISPLDALARGFVGAITRAHLWLQEGVVRQLVLVAVLVGGAVLSSIALFPKVEYLPTGNRNLAFGIVLPPPGYNLDQLVAMGRGIEKKLQPYWDVDPGVTRPEGLDGPVIEHFFFVARGRSVFMGMRARDPLRAAELVPIIQRMGAGLPGTMVVGKQSSLFERGLSAGRTIDIEISGPDLPGLVAVGGRVYGMVQAAIPGSQPIPKPSLDLSNPEVHIRLKWEKAEDMGVTAASLGYTVNSLVDGAYAGDYFVGGDKIDLTIMGQPRFAARVQDLEDLPIATPSGDVVPLRAVAEVTLGSGPEQINHRERQRAVTIQVSPPEGMALEDALERIDAQVLKPPLRVLALSLHHHPERSAGRGGRLPGPLRAESLDLPIPGRPHDDRLRHPDRASIPGAYPTRGSVPPRSGALGHPNAHPADLHDGHHDGLRPAPARALSGGGQRALPRPGQRADRRLARLHALHPLPRAHAAAIDPGRARTSRARRRGTASRIGRAVTEALARGMQGPHGVPALRPRARHRGLPAHLRGDRMGLD